MIQQGGWLMKTQYPYIEIITIFYKLRFLHSNHTGLKMLNDVMN